MSQLLLPPPTLAVSSAARAVRQCVLGQATMLALTVWSLAAVLGAPSNALQDR
ncbi:hypothetical protein IscW_ISCW020414 [Ixodes scapularis]|uniref:Uncharacterized protein n=1 Tax=Ixodes scapularis TaxID=6945 RepID=B7PZ81_IXOSC|nr:hypothetical protein IscW_ISCW020414 [Ixodes scapularis]|eukprot:XP_002404946.1 hypothetical protein IscW_ISCW020414 [Ixodes scapularis]